MRLLLVEDDPAIALAVRTTLHDAAHAVDVVSNAQSALFALKNCEHEMMLLDLGLPDRDGVDLLRELRSSNLPCQAMPVIILTANDAMEERVRGLDAGADDFLVKPFDQRELLARIRAVERRRTDNASPLLQNGRISLNPATHVASADEGAVQLTAREFSLLSALLSSPGRIFSRAELETRMYGWNEEVASNAVDFLIHRLRGKLGKDSILNVRGAGWMVEDVT